jgi:hypothetical protein
MSRRGLAAACAGLGMAALAAGYLSGRQAWAAAVLVALGLAWPAALWRGWTPSSALGLLATVGAAAAGLVQGLGAAWMLAGAMGGLLAWDLSGLERRLSLAAPDDDLALLTRRHLAWLAATAGAGLALAAAALLVRLRLPLGWMMLFALLAVAGVARLVSTLRRG